MLRDLLFVNVQSDFYVLLVPPRVLTLSLSHSPSEKIYTMGASHKSQDCEAHKY